MTNLSKELSDASNCLKLDADNQFGSQDALPVPALLQRLCVAYGISKPMLALPQFPVSETLYVLNADHMYVRSY